MFLIHLFYAVGILSFFLIIWWVLSDVLLSGPLASIGKPYKWLSKKCEKKKLLTTSKSWRQMNWSLIELVNSNFSHLYATTRFGVISSLISIHVSVLVVKQNF